MKKIRAFILMVIMISSNLNSYASWFTGGVDDTAIHAANLAANLTSKANIIKQGLEQVKQYKAQLDSLQNEYRSLQNQAKNLQQLDHGLTDRNLYILEDMFNELKRLNDNANSFAFENKKDISQLWDFYHKDPKNFQGVTGMNKQSLENLERIRYKAETDTRYAIYDSLNKAKVIAKLNDDTANQRYFEDIMNSNKNAKGSLQAIQITNNLLNKVNQNLYEMKKLIGTQVRMAGSIALAKDTGNQTREEKNKQIYKTYDKAIEDNQKDIDRQFEVWDKPVKLGYE